MTEGGEAIGDGRSGKLWHQRLRHEQSQNRMTHPFSTRVSLSTASHMVQPRSRQISSLVVFQRRYTDSMDC